MTSPPREPADLGVAVLDEEQLVGVVALLDERRALRRLVTSRRHCGELGPLLAGSARRTPGYGRVDLAP